MEPDDVLEQALRDAGMAAAVDGREQVTLADLLGCLEAPSRPVTPARITPYRDGPYLVRGPFTITDQDGNEIDARRRTVALCRCGRSQTRPFCDGRHKLTGFRASSGAEEMNADA